MDESSGKRYRAGESITDLCRACKAERAHTAIAVDADGRVLRVMCDFCRSQHNYRGGGEDAPAAPRAAIRPASSAQAQPRIAEGERTETAMTSNDDQDLEQLLRRVLREELARPRGPRG